MGLFNYNSEVSADRLERDLTIWPGGEAIVVGGGQYVPQHEADPDFVVRRAFYLEKGVHGTRHYVRGEYPGVVSMRRELSENAYDTFMRVVVPVKAYNFTVTHVGMEYTHKQIAEMAQEITPGEFYRKLIARAVLVAANGTQEQ